MTPQQIVGLGVRLFAVWLAVEGLGAALSTMQYLAANAGRSLPVSVSPWMFSTSVMFLLAAIVLWLFPMTVAHRIVPRTSFDNRLHASALEVGRVASALLGLWLLVTYLPPLIGFVARGLFLAGDESFFSSLVLSDKIRLLVTVAQALAGAYLFFQATPFARLALGPRELSGEADRAASGNADEDDATRSAP